MSILLPTIIFYQMLENDRSLVKDLKSRGYSERQLSEMGFSASAIHNPSVASMKS